MGFTCKIFGHKWILLDNKCIEKCSICDKEREVEHKWNYCKCERCKATRDFVHNWILLDYECIEKCSICGKEREVEHKWSDYKCERCGTRRDWICQRCKKAVLSREKFVSEINKMGFNLDSRGNITVSGAFRGYTTLQDAQYKVAQMEGDKAIQCKSCGKIYCVDCLSRYAPTHNTSGGKACFSCRGSLQEI